MWKKIVNEAVKLYHSFNGSKRRIALIGGLTSKIFKPYTVAAIVGEYVFYIFGSADLVDKGNEKLKEKLPGGLRK
jgi:hypothetical protein